MNTEMNGKAIDYIDLDPVWTQGGSPERIVACDGCTLHLSATFHGDHEQYWIILSEKGQEVARYSPRGVQHIRWSQPQGK